MAQAGESHSPLDQFLIKKIIPLDIGGVDISFTNSSLAMLAGIVIVSCFLVFSMRRGALVPGRWQVLAEIAYEFIANMIRDNVGQEGRRYFPFIFTLFMFVLAGNMLGMIPYSFTFTSHLIVTFGMAAVVFIGVTIIGIMKHGIRFFGFFLPHGVPWFLAWLIIPIEILSYLSRPVSLSLRLFANMTAGHTMLKV
ncbi:MAG: F0F1 ATP synthase subunit A, partial [Alphaproteobacteria bacterium]|nr:F0F1 ATP synthase subunit A [Alphaproteobacteria bacterium]